MKHLLFLKSCAAMIWSVVANSISLLVDDRLEKHKVNKKRVSIDKEVSFRSGQFG